MVCLDRGVRVLRFTDFNTSDFGWRCCQLLTTLNEDHADRFLPAVWSAVGFGPAKIVIFPSGPLLPRAFAAVTSEFIVVGISGTDDARQVWEYLSSSFEFRVGLKAGAFNGTFDGWGKEAFRRIEAEDPRHEKRIILFGHSYGGAVVTCAAIELAKVRRPFTVSCVTFGQPKVGDADYISDLDRVFYWRWVNEGDPIPPLPPSEGELGVVPIKINLLLRTLSGVFTHSPPVSIVNRFGQVTGETFPTLLPNLLDLIELIGEEDFDPRRFEAHTLHVYLERQILLTQRRATFRSLPGGDLYKMFPPGQVTRTQLLDIQAAAPMPIAVLGFPAIAGLGRDPVEVTVMIPDKGTAFVPSQFQAKVRPDGFDYGVYLGGIQICRDATKSKCLTVAKHLNRLLRRFQVVDITYSTGIDNALSFFFAASVAGVSGFRPNTHTVTP